MSNSYGKATENGLVFAKNVSTNKIDAIATTSPLQVGITNYPAGLILTGDLSISKITAVLSSGEVFLVPNNVTVINVSTTSNSGTLYVTLPQSPREGQVIYVKDSDGIAGTVNITVSGNSGSKIDGASTKTIDVNYGTLQFIWNSGSWSTLNSIGTGTPGTPGTNGRDGYTVTLSPDSVSLTTDNTGTPVSYSNTATTITVYKGVTELNGITTGTPTTGQFSVTAVGTNITPGSQTSSGNPVEYDVASALTSTSAKIVYTINIEGVATAVRTQTISISRKGDTGTNGTNGTNGRDAYNIVIDPSSVTLSANVSGTPTSYSGSATTISAYNGGTELNGITSGTPGSGEFKVTASGTNITPGSQTSSGNQIEFSEASSMTSTYARIAYTINLENYITITRTQTFSIARTGNTGATGATGTSGSSYMNYQFTAGSCAESVVRYLYPGHSTSAASTTIVEVIAPSNLELSNLYVRQITGNNGTTYIRVTVNGSVSDLSLDMPFSDSTDNNKVDTVSVSAGDTIGVQIALNGGLGGKILPTNFNVSFLGKIV